MTIDRGATEFVKHFSIHRMTIAVDHGRKLAEKSLKTVTVEFTGTIESKQKFRDFNGQHSVSGIQWIVFNEMKTIQ